MQNVNPSFNIQAPDINTESAQLFIEAGPMGISFVILNTGNCFQAVVSYSFTNTMAGTQVMESLNEILQTESLLTKKYKKTHIFWLYPESILVPPELMKEDSNIEMLNLVYGDAKKNISKSDFLYKHNLYNIYRVPEDVHESFMTQLPFANQTHQYSLLVNRETNGGDELFVNFYSNSLTLMLCKEKKLQAVQNFTYSNPDDTAYHLLNVCKNFEVRPDTVKLYISGLIDKKSNLYTAVYKYFLNIEFYSLPENFTYAREIKEYPPHYFSNLFDLASCV